MCIYGYITKQQINIEKEKKIGKIIQINDNFEFGARWSEVICSWLTW